MRRFQSQIRRFGVYFNNKIECTKQRKLVSIESLCMHCQHYIKKYGISTGTYTYSNELVHKFNSNVHFISMYPQIAPNFASYYPKPGDEIQGYSGYRNIMSVQPKAEPGSFNWDIVGRYDPEKLERKANSKALYELIDEFVNAEFSLPDLKIIQNPLVFRLIQQLQVIIRHLLNFKSQSENDSKTLKKEVDSLRKHLAKKEDKYDALLVSYKKYKYAERCPTCNKIFASKIQLDKHIINAHKELVQSWTAMRTGKAPLILEPDEEFQDQIDELRKMVRAQNNAFIDNMKEKQKKKQSERKAREESGPSPGIQLYVPISPFNQNPLFKSQNSQVKEFDQGQDKIENITNRSSNNVDQMQTNQFMPDITPPEYNHVTAQVQTEQEFSKRKLPSKSIRQRAEQFVSKKKETEVSIDIDNRVNKIRDQIADRIHKQSQIMKLKANKKEKEELQTHLLDEALGNKKPLSISMAYFLIQKKQENQEPPEEISISGSSSLGNYTSVTFVPEEGFVAPLVPETNSSSSSSTSSSSNSGSSEESSSSTYSTQDSGDVKKKEKKKKKDKKDKKKDNKDKIEEKPGNQKDEIASITGSDFDDTVSKGTEQRTTQTNDADTPSTITPETPKKDLGGVQFSSSDLDSISSTPTDLKESNSKQSTKEITYITPKPDEGSDF